MRGLIVIGITGLTLTAAAIAVGKPPKPAASIREPELRKELLQRQKEDQAVRFEWVEVLQKTSTEEGSRDEQLLAEAQRIQQKLLDVDAANTLRMKEIVEEFGWPGRSLVGKDGAKAAWLLVQHADKDLAFQKNCLALMEAMPKGEVVGQDVAYLVDRVLVAEGKPQRYGSQLQTTATGELVLYPIEDQVNVDVRRKAMGMEPLNKYVEKAREVMKTPFKKDTPLPDHAPTPPPRSGEA